MLQSVEQLLENSKEVKFQSQQGNENGIPKIFNEPPQKRKREIYGEKIGDR